MKRTQQIQARIRKLEQQLSDVEYELSKHLPYDTLVSWGQSVGRVAYTYRAGNNRRTAVIFPLRGTTARLIRVSRLTVVADALVPCTYPRRREKREKSYPIVPVSEHLGATAAEIAAGITAEINTDLARGDWFLPEEIFP